MVLERYILNNMDDIKILLSAQRAMLFNICPKFRMISVELMKDSTLKVLVIISESLTEEEEDLAYSFSGEIEGDYPEIVSSNVFFLLDTQKIDNLPRLKYVVFSLYE